jgi:hypothetical protein
MLIALLSAVFFLLTASTPGDGPAILFAVWTIKTSTRIEPIALVRRVAYARASVEFIKPPPEKELIETYYRTGEMFAVLRGGREAGSVKVLPYSYSGCSPVEALVTRTGGERPAGWWSGDAIAAGPLPLWKPSRAPHDLSDRENAEVRELVQRLFRIKAVPEEALAHITHENLVAVDLDGDGRTDFIGTYHIDEAKHRHSLFVVAMRDGSGALRADVIRYDRALTSKDDALSKNWTLLDIEDFDGDGVYEIIVSNHGWEWTTYDILKLRREGEWDIVYSGGGSGC